MDIESCTASSWRSSSHRPYGPGGFNRCVRPAAEEHEVHLDGFGNRFVRSGSSVKVVS